jgi:hypothetical protein
MTALTALNAETGLARTHPIFSLAHATYDQFAGTKNYSAVRTHSILIRLTILKKQIPAYAKMRCMRF